MDQIVSIAHVGDGDNASCLGQQGLPELFQETHHWDQEQYLLRYAQPVASPLNIGVQIDYADVSNISIILGVLHVFTLREKFFRRMDKVAASIYNAKHRPKQSVMVKTDLSQAAPIIPGTLAS